MKSKTLLIVLTMVLIAAVSVMGTLAYLTAEDTTVNTFTVGQVALTVDETKVDTDGNPILDGEGNEQRIPDGNEYHLLPGMKYRKDPTVTVGANSEEAYVRMILKVHNASAVQALIDKYQLGDFSGLIEGWDSAKWLYEGFVMDTENNAISFEFRYFEPVETGEDPLSLEPLFEKIVVPAFANGEELLKLQEGGFKMEITGHGIQTAGFENEDAAWAAFDEQVAFEAEHNANNG